MRTVGIKVEAGLSQTTGISFLSPQEWVPKNFITNILMLVNFFTGVFKNARDDEVETEGGGEFTDVS